VDLCYFIGKLTFSWGWDFRIYRWLLSAAIFGLFRLVQTVLQGCLVFSFCTVFFYIRLVLLGLVLPALLGRCWDLFPIPCKICLFRRYRIQFSSGGSFFPPLFGAGVCSPWTVYRSLRPLPENRSQAGMQSIDRGSVWGGPFTIGFFAWFQSLRLIRFLSAIVPIIPLRWPILVSRHKRFVVGRSPLAFPELVSVFYAEPRWIKPAGRSEINLHGQWGLNIFIQLADLYLLTVQRQCAI